MKKILSVLLAVCMIATMFTALPFSASAEKVQSVQSGSDVSELCIGDEGTLTLGRWDSCTFTFTTEECCIPELFLTDKGQNTRFEAEIRKKGSYDSLVRGYSYSDWDEDVHQDVLLFVLLQPGTYEIEISARDETTLSYTFSEHECQEIEQTDAETEIEFVDGLYYAYCSFVPENNMIVINRVDGIYTPDVYDGSMIKMEEPWSYLILNQGETYIFECERRSSGKEGESYTLRLEKLSDIEDITLNTRTHYDPAPDGKIQYYKFVPEKSFPLWVHSDSPYVYGDDNDAYWASKEIRIEDSQLRSIESANTWSGDVGVICDVEAGETYYIEIDNASAYDTDAFDFILQNYAVFEQDKEKEISLTGNGEEKLYEFTPEKDMTLRISQTQQNLSKGASVDYTVRLLDAAEKELSKKTFTVTASEDTDSDEDLEDDNRDYYKQQIDALASSLIEDVKGGETYYIAFSAKNSDDPEADVTASYEITELPTLYADQTHEGERATYYQFTPEKTGYYVVLNGSNLLAFDKDMNELVRIIDDGWSDGDSEDAVFYAEAGKPLYLMGSLTSSEYNQTTKTTRYFVRLQSIPEIKVGETKTVSAKERNTTAYYYYKPTKDTSVRYFSEGSLKTEGRVFIGMNGKKYWATNSGNNFSYQFGATNGQVYFLKSDVREWAYRVADDYTYEGDDRELFVPGSYQVKLEEVSEYEIEGTTLKKYNGGKTNPSVPSTVTDIGYGAFLNCSSLKAITVPEKVKSISGYAFAGCYNLEDVKLPSKLPEIEPGLFSGCSSLKTVDIPSTVTDIGYQAFMGCSSLTKIDIPDKVKSIGDHAFYNDSDLSEVNIGKSVTTIDDYAFFNCQNLKSVTIPSSVTEIGEYAFGYTIEFGDYGIEYVPVEGFVIKGAKGSAAEEYAEEYDLPFEATGGTPVVQPTEKPADPKIMTGDADQDGIVSVLDATRIQKYKASLCNLDGSKFDGSAPSEALKKAADVDSDGVVSVLDATRIQKFKAHLCNLDGTTPYIA